MRSIAIEALGIRSFRNLASVDLELGAGLNVVSGDNGQGKTNVIESLYVVATSRSFRTASLSDLVTFGATTASIRAVVREGGANAGDSEGPDVERREQSVGLQRGLRAVRVDGKRPPSLAAYAVRTPAVVFHPAAVALSSGGGAERRKLLDRIALHLEPSSLGDADSYAKAVRARQRVLEARGEHAADLDGWEELATRHGLALSEARNRAFLRLSPAAQEVFARIGAPGMALGLTYERGAPADAETFRSELARRRAQDRARGSATVGPHRDELALTLGGRPVRGIASQGQHRSVVLSLDLAEIEVIGAARGVRPMLLLDDVSSELDRWRTAALFGSLRDHESQVVLTTTRPELIDTSSLAGAVDRRDFVVVGGRVVAS